MLRGRALGQILWATPEPRCPGRDRSRLVTGHVPAAHDRYRSRMPDEYRSLEMDDGVRFGVSLHFQMRLRHGRWSSKLVRTGRTTSPSDADDRRLCDEGGPRGLPGRRPRHRLLGGRPSRTSTRPESCRSRGDDRLAREPALVQRQRRDVRHVVLGLQLAAGGRAPSPGAQGDHPDLRDGPRYTDDVHYGGGAGAGSTSSTTRRTWSR